MTTERQYYGENARTRCENAGMRERESTMTGMRQYDDDSATIRWRECENAMT
ncbi:hypothetical protein DPMN_068177 [Dreissena polymorpha]|uniref:Uncharacterized protein n=1 Tax=Dreissena polymorpha TaxID=45954 RepID=A0A9D3YX51_DREPO|nr:hypothetical protein DPMN_068177 [Dreissena polymorpha]